METLTQGTKDSLWQSERASNQTGSVKLWTRLKQTNTVGTQIKRWTPDTESILQDCFAQTDWDVFKAAAIQEDSSINIELYAEYVTDYISSALTT
ncbi:hypothetical protein L3Q82_001541 [Scortum barcoo]|uniref:Uncharacterized protein n=1 Tax=Scortum barcoo TaxID=214431 RepID=A0ACB8W8E0_9TELE|nr:hypothetical protein L3Q82_001541 [Scortum barcoo]